MLATYIHNWDPVIFDVAGPIKLRWYGLSYLLAFVLGFLLLRWLAKKKLWVLPAEKVADFIAYCAFFGVFLGGRIGYVLFYQMQTDKGRATLADDPLSVFKVWDGGMASHGGILGLVIFTYYYARKNKVSWTGVGDGLCVVAPIGIGLVRMANFINGELYGRVANSCSWAMKFPSALWENGKARQAVEACRPLAPEINQIDGSTSQGFNQQLNYLIAQSRDRPELLNALGQHLEARHPSQLYEGLLEGLVLFLILFILRVRVPKLANGVLTGLFFVLYAVFRIIVENFRQPDVGQAFILGLTKGQFYSTFMIIGGLCFIGFALKNKRTVES
ncbi:MAG: prolipoprotein diacylglyceryl transferase [Akkermansiaceae bacterium]